MFHLKIFIAIVFGFNKILYGKIFQQAIFYQQAFQVWKRETIVIDQQHFMGRHLGLYELCIFVIAFFNPLALIFTFSHATFDIFRIFYEEQYPIQMAEIASAVFPLSEVFVVDK